MTTGPRSLRLLVLLSLIVAPGCGGCGKHETSQVTNDDGDGVSGNVNFGNVLLNQPSAPHRITVTNSGSAPLAIEHATLGGADATDFKLTSSFPTSIAPGASASVTGVFTPSAAGNRTATLSVVTDGESGTLAITLTGFGVDIEICAAPPTLAFGDVQVLGSPVFLSVIISNCGQSPANFSLGTISGAQAADFNAANTASTTLQPNDQVTVQVAYAPQAVGASVGSLAYQACDTEGDCAPASIGLTGTGVDGALTFAPDPVAFSGVPSGQTVSQTVTATNTGTEPISLTGLAIQSGLHTVFAITGASSLPNSLSVGQSTTFTVTYTPSSAAGGDSDALVGTFTVADATVAARTVTDPLTGNGQAAPCSITVSPTSLNFGNVPPATATTYSVTLTNLSSTSSCDISSVALSSTSDPSYSLPTAQSLSFPLAPSGTAQISVTIDPANASTPLLKNGTLTFDTNGTPATGSVPLVAYVNSACAQAATQVIYTVDEDGTFCSFDPTTLTFSVIGTLSCPDFGTPFSMAVDQNAVAWVLYSSGDIYKVNTTNAACSSTSFRANQSGLLNFGMSFASDPSTGTDILYVAGGETMSASPTTLATIAFPSLALTTVGTVSLGWPELTGTGDGQLWGFVPSDLSTSGVPVLGQLNPATGATLPGAFNLPQVSADSDDNFALKFYGGAFWLFLGRSVYEIQRSNGAFTTPLPNSGHAVVGAGVSTCVPVQ